MTRAAIFAAVKAQKPEVWNDPGNIHAMDNLLDALGVAREDTGRHISAKGIDLIKRFEGCKLTAYPDPGSGGDPWTIGYGATGPGIARGVTWTQAQCEARLVADLAKFEAAVRQMAPATTQDQFDALVSFAFNVGPENLKGSTLLRLHNAGDYGGASLQFPRWNHAAGRVLPGLTTRRNAEAALYRGDA